MTKIEGAKEALAACPFCGGLAEFSVGKTGDGKDWNYIECSDCGALGPGVNYADHAIKLKECLADAWNRRNFSASFAQAGRYAMKRAAVIAHLEWQDCSDQWDKVIDAVIDAAPPQPSAEVERMREALEPFAKLGALFLDPDNQATKGDGRPVWGYNAVDLTYGDFRRAWSVLNGGSDAG